MFINLNIKFKFEFYLINIILPCCQNMSKDNFNILVLGAAGVGRSYFIEKCVSNSKVDPDVYTNVDPDLFGCARILIDTPGIQNVTELETLLKRVNQVDYVILCISATKEGHIREIDLRTLDIISEFDHLLNNLIVHITKMDLLDDYERRRFMNNYEKKYQFKNFKIFSEKSFNTMNTKCERTQQQILEDKFYRTFIDKIQQQMKIYNLYPPEYKKYDTSDSFIKPFICASVVFLFIMFLRTEDMEFMFYLFIATVFALLFVFCLEYLAKNDTSLNIRLIRLIDAPEVVDQINVTLYYKKTGRVFYEGTMFGNVFDIGTFYKETGEVLYEKIL